MESPLNTQELEDAGQWDINLLEAEANYVPKGDESSKPSGQSVYDADSVVGESGNLYHGYKQGRYLLPNDAVKTPLPDFEKYPTNMFKRPSKIVSTSCM